MYAWSKSQCVVSLPSWSHFPTGKKLVDTNSKVSLNQLNGKIYKWHCVETEGGRKQSRCFNVNMDGRGYLCQVLYPSPAPVPSPICLLLMVIVDEGLHVHFECLSLFLSYWQVFFFNSHFPRKSFSHLVSLWFLKNQQAESGTIILIYSILKAILSPCT